MVGAGRSHLVAEVFQLEATGQTAFPRPFALKAQFGNLV